LACRYARPSRMSRVYLRMTASSKAPTRLSSDEMDPAGTYSAARHHPHDTSCGATAADTDTGQRRVVQREVWSATHQAECRTLRRDAMCRSTARCSGGSADA
jgi:hypothetical protein